MPAHFESECSSNCGFCSLHEFGFWAQACLNQVLGVPKTVSALSAEGIGSPKPLQTAAMSMKYLGAYLMAVIGGKENPTEADIKTILEAGGIGFEDLVSFADSKDKFRSQIPDGPTRVLR